MPQVKIKAGPFDDQKPGTSGLRKKTRVFMQPDYLACFVQSVFRAIGGADGKTFVLGGDGRYFNSEAIQTILKLAAANRAAKVIVGQGGLLSTPAVSHIIRLRGADGGLVLSASHNPGGVDADFGIKYNVSNGGPAPEYVTQAIFEETQSICEYAFFEADDVDLTMLGTFRLGNLTIEVIDPVHDYQNLMESLFDFDAISKMFQSGFRMTFDAMHAVTGPYAKAIIEDRLGAPEGSVVNALPSPDFGGGHPDPNPVWAKSLMKTMMSPDAPDFGAASDGDGDRNMIVGRGIYVTPSDSLAVLAANAHLAPAYKAGLSGVARSMPTSTAVDRVAKSMGMGCYETPTGWKFFGNLLDAGKVSLCGEESAGTGSDHVREKDGLWAVLLWLNILAARRMSVADVLADHWARFGRNYYTRLDYEALPTSKASALMADLKQRLPDLVGKTFAGKTVEKADSFSYADPIDGSVSENQGLRVFYQGGARAVLRLSGTGTEGATLRVYLEEFADPDADHKRSVKDSLAGVREATVQLTAMSKHLGRVRPDVET